MLTAACLTTQRGFSMALHCGCHHCAHACITALMRASLCSCVQLNLTVRKCRLGEISVRNGTICQPCEPGFYSIDPLALSCKPCPEHATCNPPDENGVAGIIVPDEGYFNTNPFSEQVQGRSTLAVMQIGTGGLT